MHGIYELKEKLCKELEGYGTRELNAGSLDVVDTLAHAIKNIDKILEGEDGGHSLRGMPMYGGYAYDDGMDGGMGGRSRRGGSYDDGSSYRGRGYSMRRDSMGRYSRDAGKDEFTRHLQELVDMAPNDRMRQQVERIIRETDQN